MASKSSQQCLKLREAFEGQEAIYIDKGVLRVRVTSTRCYTDRINATVEEAPTKGLEHSLFHLREPDAERPLRWQISAGYLTTFCEHTWSMGYAGWTLFFGPALVKGFVNMASDWPDELDAVARYNEALRYVYANHKCESEYRVFPDRRFFGFLGGG